MIYMNLIVTTSQKPEKDTQKQKRKEPNKTANHKAKGQEKKGTAINCKNNQRKPPKPINKW